MNETYNDFKVAGPLEIEKMAREYSRTLAESREQISGKQQPEEIVALFQALIALYEHISNNVWKNKEFFSALAKETQEDLLAFSQNPAFEKTILPRSFSAAVKYAIHLESELAENLLPEPEMQEFIQKRLKNIRNLVNIL